MLHYPDLRRLPDGSPPDLQLPTPDIIGPLAELL